MHTKLFKATFALITFSFLLVACHKDKDMNEPSKPKKLLDGLGICFGSATGPGNDLFVPDAQAGAIYRIDLKTGDKTIIATGLPNLIPEIGLGGVMDVVFTGGKLYALVSVVDDASFPTGQVNGIYRIDGPSNFKVIADLGAFNVANQPTGFFIDVPTGVSYSIDTYRGGFLVNDGHLNRVLQVTLDGKITVVHQFPNIVPTGLAVRDNMIFISQAGPVPHDPADGKVLALSHGKVSTVTEVAAGAPLLVDVEFGRGHSLFALSQGAYSGRVEGSPALPNTGSLLSVNTDKTFSKVADKLNIPTSLEIINNTAYIITIEGEVWKVDNIDGPPYGRPH
ncbi:ScyD/ScyE family protein [Flavitalea antarctica]